MMNRPMFIILTTLAKHEKPLSSKELTTRLAAQGVGLSERTVRHYLKRFDEDGFTTGCLKRGRTITAKGREELRHGFVSERMSFVINRINNLSVLSDFSPDTCRGKVILNITNVVEGKITEALTLLSLLLNSPYSMSDRIVVAKAGERLGDDGVVPQGVVAVGTICSMTLNSVFLKAGIPVSTKLGGVVEIEGFRPVGFSSVISYEGSSVPPLEIFMKGRMTDVLGAVHDGTGRVLGSFREIPANSLLAAKVFHEKLRNVGIPSPIIFGQPNEPLLGLPVTEGKVGLVVLGGLNPNAGLEEAGLGSDSRAMATLYDFIGMNPIRFTEGVVGAAGLSDAREIARYSDKRRKENDGYWSVLREL